MKKIYVSLVILFSIVLSYLLSDKDIPVILPKNEVKKIIETNPFKSSNPFVYEEVFEISKGEIELFVNIEKNDTKEIIKPLEAHINSCDEDCLRQIKQKFYTNIQNREVTNAILQEIFSFNSPELLEFLSEVIVVANETNNLELINDINAYIRAIKSKEVLISLIESLLNNKDSGYAYSHFPTSTSQAITYVINDQKDRANIIPVLEHVYFSDKNLIEEFLPELDYPEIYSLIALKASDIGDLRLKETAIENLINNTSNFSVPAIYLYAEKNNSSTAVDDTFYLAREWGSRHLNPKSLDIAEAYLHGSLTSTAVKIASIGILSSMDDKEKLLNILTKVRQYSEDSIVDAYVDEIMINTVESEALETLSR